MLLEEHRGMAKPMALFVLKYKLALQFYRRHGFDVLQVTSTKLLMRRAMAEAA
jgi:hypothetical protein